MRFNLGTLAFLPVLIFHRRLFNTRMINSKIRLHAITNISIGLLKGRTILYILIICPKEYIRLKDFTQKIIRRPIMMVMVITFTMEATVIMNKVFCIIRWSQNIQPGLSQVILQVEAS